MIQNVTNPMARGIGMDIDRFFQEYVTRAYGRH